MASSTALKIPIKFEMSARVKVPMTRFPKKPTLEDLAGRTIFGQRIPVDALPPPGTKSSPEALQKPNTAKDKKDMRDWNAQPALEPPFDPKNKDWLRSLPPGTDSAEYSQGVNYGGQRLSGESKGSEASAGERSVASPLPANDFPEADAADVATGVKQIGTPANRAFERWLERSPQIW